MNKIQNIKIEQNPRNIYFLMKLKFFTFPACLSRQKHINTFKSTKQHRQPFASFYCHRGVTHLLHSPTGWLCCLLYVGGWKKDFPIFSYFWELRGAVCISYASKARERESQTKNRPLSPFVTKQEIS